jgi:hypothetical protein
MRRLSDPTEVFQLWREGSRLADNEGLRLPGPLQPTADQRGGR